MHRLTTALAASALLASSTVAVAQDETPLESVESQASYALGYSAVRQMFGNGLAQDILDIDAYILGVREAFEDKDSKLTREQVTAAFEEMQSRMIAAQEAERKERANVALEEGRTFLERNATNDGITVTESGLQYRVVTEGVGASPTADQTVTVHYEGRLLNGDVFDSSIARDQPASFPVSGVIRGWVEALQLMKPGAEWEEWIPSELAYGPTGAGAGIGPNEVLNFTIQLISIDE